MRYIDADKLSETIKEHAYLLCDSINSRDYGMFLDGIMQAIDETPTANVEEVRHGHWIKFTIQDGVYEHMKCSNCSFYWSMSQHSNIFLRCPHCGALMDEEEQK